MLCDQIVERLVVAFGLKDYSNLTNSDIVVLVRHKIICRETANRILDHKKSQGNLLCPYV